MKVLRILADDGSLKIIGWFSCKWLANSDLLFLSSRSFYCILTLRTASPIQVWSQEQSPQ